MLAVAPALTMAGKWAMSERRSISFNFLSAGCMGFLLKSSSAESHVSKSSLWGTGVVVSLQ